MVLGILLLVSYLSVFKDIENVVMKMMSFIVTGTDEVTKIVKIANVHKVTLKGKNSRKMKRRTNVISHPLAEGHVRLIFCTSKRR